MPEPRESVAASVSASLRRHPKGRGSIWSGKHGLNSGLLHETQSDWARPMGVIRVLEVSRGEMIWTNRTISLQVTSRGRLIWTNRTNSHQATSPRQQRLHNLGGCNAGAWLNAPFHHGWSQLRGIPTEESTWSGEEGRPRPSCLPGGGVSYALGNIVGKETLNSCGPFLLRDHTTVKVVPESQDPLR